MIKIQLHIHTNQDPLDTFIDYGPYKLIDEAFKNRYNVLSFTHHRKIICDKNWIDYAWKRNILLISGVEYEIFGKHILVYNASEELYKVKNFKQLKEFKKSNPLIKIVAPHPFYPGKFCLRKYLIEYHDIFDGVEYSSYYSKFFGKKYNKKAIEFAKKYNKTLIGNSDIHNLININDTYSLIGYRINFKNNYNTEVINFLNVLFNRNTKVYIYTQPYSVYKLFSYNVFFLKGRIKRYLKI